MSRFATPEIKTAIVTGAASGIGAAEVRRLQDRGVTVVAADLNDQIVGQYAGQPSTIGVVADVTKPEDAGKGFGG